jgi:GAF domain-containing protein
LQYANNQGPCLEALRTQVPVFVTDMATETRWPPYTEQARQVGAQSSLSYPLIHDTQCLGALNFYAFQPLVPGMDLQARAAAIAGHAAGALALALRLAERDDLITRLRLALSSRSTIDQAMGILMAQQRCTAPTAFDLLRTASQGRNIKLRDVATRIITGIERDVGDKPSGRY